jgi:hypothetical protein
MSVYFLCGEPLDSKKSRENHTTALRFQNLQLKIYAFRPLARDGAGNIEVMIRLQKPLTAFMPSIILKIAAMHHSIKLLKGRNRNEI